jgi:hypothetical protein
VPLLNRAARRDIERRFGRERREYNAWINEGSDATRPLVYYGGFVHNSCGGEAERANNRAIGAFCIKCDRHVPRSEISRAETT